MEAPRGRCRLESGSQEEAWDMLVQSWEFWPRGCGWEGVDGAEKGVPG